MLLSQHFTELLVADGASGPLVRVAAALQTQDIDGAEAGMVSETGGAVPLWKDACGNRDRPTSP